MSDHDYESRYSWLAEGNAKQARKRVAAKVLIRDRDGRVLLVNPTYKENWDLPGGMVEANESPRLAAEREIAEELDLRVKVDRLLGLDWIGPHGPWDDQLVFVFDGGILSNDSIDTLRIADDEISEFGFFTVSEAHLRLRSDVAERLARAVGSLGADRTHYAEKSLLDHTD